MLRRSLAILILASLVFSFAGCSKKTDDQVSSEPVAKSVAEYKAEADSQINKDNMLSELDKLEKSVDADISSDE